MPSVDQLIVWIAVGLLGGSLAGVLVTWEREGFGLFRNLEHVRHFPIRVGFTNQANSAGPRS